MRRARPERYARGEPAVGLVGWELAAQRLRCLSFVRKFFEPSRIRVKILLLLPFAERPSRRAPKALDAGRREIAGPGRELRVGFTSSRASATKSCSTQGFTAAGPLRLKETYVEISLEIKLDIIRPVILFVIA